MSQELDRRIAEEVMGESEPAAPTKTQAHDAWVGSHVRLFRYSEGRNWFLWYVGGRGEFGWQPVGFSSEMRHAERAVGKYFAERRPHDDRRCPELFVAYRPTADDAYEASLDGKAETAATLPEAICKLLAKLVGVD